MIVHAIFFYTFSLIAILSAIMVTVSRNTVHSVFFLILDFISVSCLFIMIGAEFLGMIMLIVYVGAVAVLFLFVVMMLNVVEQKNTLFEASSDGKHIPIGLLISLIIFFEVIIVLRYKVKKPLFYGSIMIALTTLMFVVQSIFGNNMNLFILTIALDNFTGGFAGTVFIAYLSSLTDPKYTATQYALFSSLMLVPGKFLSGFSGLIVDNFGYSELFMISASLGIPAIIISYYLSKNNVKV